MSRDVDGRDRALNSLFEIKVQCGLQIGAALWSRAWRGATARSSSTE
jgi:hypothetical protein